MLIVALVLAVIGLAALVTAVVTSNALIAWVCIGASVIGVVLLIVDALRERSRGAGATDDADDDTDADAATDENDQTTVLEHAEDYPEESSGDTETETFSSQQRPTNPANDDVPPATTSERI